MLTSNRMLHIQHPTSKPGMTHELLKKGVSEFSHVATTNSGHYIMVDEPALIFDHLNILISKLP